MATNDGLLFLDSNQYLYFYKAIQGRKLLKPLVQHRKHVFVTTKIVKEVERNKLGSAADLLKQHLERLMEEHPITDKDVKKMHLPDHLFDVSNETAVQLKKILRPLATQIAEMKRHLKDATRETLHRISRSEDKVSKDLEKIFLDAVKATADELERARARKENGNPPGKQGQPLGDQLNWEQLLTQCKVQKKKRVWIISRDKDYYTEHDGNLFLNPVLHQELRDIGAEAYCFDHLDKGIPDFVLKMGLEKDKLPNEEQSKAIEEELHSLPFISGMDPSMAYFENYLHRRRFIAPFFVTQGTQDTPFPLKHGTLGQEDTPIPPETETP